MNRVTLAITSGLAFGILDVLLMIPLSMPNKGVAMTGAFFDRCAIGFLICVVDLPLPGWLTGLLVITARAPSMSLTSTSPLDEPRTPHASTVTQGSEGASDLDDEDAAQLLERVWHAGDAPQADTKGRRHPISPWPQQPVSERTRDSVAHEDHLLWPQASGTHGDVPELGRRLRQCRGRPVVGKREGGGAARPFLELDVEGRRYARQPGIPAPAV
jgi:hypothetical protein